MGTLANSSLTPDERTLLERFAALLHERLGEELHAIWLYGSRARGEPPREESDVDLLVLVDDASWEASNRVYMTLWDAAREVNLESIASWFSVRTDTLEWLEGRREIKSFFIAEVDRDKVVIEGPP